MQPFSIFFFWLFVGGDLGSGRVRALNLTVPLGSGRVGSDNLGYGPGSGFSFEPVQTSRERERERERENKREARDKKGQREGTERALRRSKEKQCRSVL